MSLWQHLASWIAPFKSRDTIDTAVVERQTREAETLLRQIRAELRLMRRWREDEQGTARG